MLIFRNLVFGTKSSCHLVIQFSRRVKWRDVCFPSVSLNINAKPFTTSVCNLVKYTSKNPWTDDTFSDRVLKSLKEPKVFVNGLYNMFGEFGKLYEEKKECFFLNSRQMQCQNPDNLVEMLFTFDSDDELNKFMVSTDSSHYGGYSSASLKMTPEKTGLFSGHISTDPVRDGEAKFTGYATMSTRKVLKSFKRIKYFDWSYYSHIVFKVKGDGRTYYVHISVPASFENEQCWVYSYPLFTRGGPYWQVSKIALSDFFFISRGALANYQPKTVYLNKLYSLGLTTRQVQGSFKLEIDYIGLEYKRLHRQISPYEQYS